MFSTDIHARDLVTCDQILDAGTPIRDLVQWFKSRPEIDYVTIVDNGEVAGLAGRDQLNAKLAGQYGFSVMADKPVARIMIPSPLVVDGACTLLELTRRLMESGRSGPDFYHDILVHENGELLGLLPVKGLLMSQMRQIMQQMGTLQKQSDILAQRNRELADATIRLGQESADFTSFVEKTSIPMMVLHADGSYARANGRYLRLTGHLDAKSPLGLPCAKLLRGGSATLEACAAAEVDGIGDSQMSHRLLLLKHDGSELSVEASVDRDHSGKHWVVSVVRIAGGEEQELQRVLRERLRGRGKLANSLVEQLIDRDSDADQLLNRLQHVLALADQMESSPGMLPDGGASGNSGYFQGDLTTFNLVDLLQLFVQARKTGQLIVESEIYGTGVVFFDTGRFIHAACMAQPAGTETIATDAVQALLRFQGGRFQFVENAAPTETTIQADPMGLLMRCMTDIDEESIAAYA